MKISDLDEVARLIKHRAGFVHLAKIAKSNYFNCNFVTSGENLDVASWLDVSPIRQRIIRLAEEQQESCEMKLQALGVDVSA